MTNDASKNHCQPCERFGAKDYSRYVRSHMPEQEVIELETHAMTCSNCLQGIRLASVIYHQQKELEENEILYSSALSIMDRLDQSIFTVVIRAVQGVVELIRSTGEQLSMAPASGGVRSVSGESTSDTVQPLRLVKEFEGSRFSVEVTISPVEPDMLDVTVSLLDRQQEEFIAGVDVSCCGESGQFDDVTDENGKVVFKVPSSGFYELTMKKDDNLLGTMTLTGL